MATFSISDEDLNKIGILGEGVPEVAAKALEMMRKRPDLLTPSLFALECASLQGHQYKGPSSLPLPSSPTFSDSSTLSTVPTLSLAGDAPVVSEHSPSAYERANYYNGIAGNSGHPDLLYRSDALTNPFLKPTCRFAHVPVKSVHGVFETRLNEVWDTIAPEIREIVKSYGITKNYTIDTARFFTHAPPGEEEKKGSLGPVVVWICVQPGATSADIAHDASQQILALLQKHEVEGVVVEWRESVVQRLAGPPLLPPSDRTDAGENEENIPAASYRTKS